uniref:Ig-like domain-containing protein n=1 Tax=Echinostoma caproni TaxID=27848 RepID=A0A183A8V0_9TREM
LECAPSPPNPAARINWLGPDGVVVSDSSNLSVELTAAGSVTDAPGPSGRYTIAIIQTPLTFRYSDAVRLRCVVQPDPPHVQFEWQKDGQIIGRTSELYIPSFTPYDVGRYQCVARIEGYTDISSNTTVLPGPDESGPVELIMRPGVIYLPAFSPLQIECISQRPNLQPVARFANGMPVESDNRFRVNRPDSQRLVITAPGGLSNVYNGHRIQCVLPGVGDKETTLYIIDRCVSSESQCRNRECVPTSKLCDGRPDCSDRSDEGEDFCNAGVTVSPTRIVVRPGEAFRLQCQSLIRGQMPYARFVYSGANVEQDPRFRTERPTRELLVIHAPRGLDLSDNNTRIDCIPTSGFCDGIRQCPDGSDEMGCANLTCHAPKIACPSGECIDPSRRCDGRQDCRDGFDERGCPSRCPSPKFECGSGECLTPGQRCDGRRDCADGSDEINCRVPCLPPNMYCSSGECIGPHAKCDGRVDCADGSDERDCATGPSFRPTEPRVRPYGTLEIECVSGKPGVRPQVTLSNGSLVEQLHRFIVSYPSAERIVVQLHDVTERDRGLVFRCSYPTGETTEARVIVDSPCGSSEMMCRNGMCIPYYHFCNGAPDCPDGSDEQAPHCADTQCHMNQYKCASGECIDISRRCDGRQDCYDGSDEVGCSSRPSIRPERPIVRPYGSLEIECRSYEPGIRPELRLSNGSSLELLPRFTVSRPQHEVIIAVVKDLTERDRNMVVQCIYPTGEMSQAEIVIESPCGPSEWMCRDGSCLPQSYFCNGRAECRDGSDEQWPHCETTSRCQSYEFVCGSSECIDSRRRCDGHRDCYDGSDEVGCVEIECRSNQPNIRPELRLPNGTAVEYLPRFEVIRPQNEVVIARISDLTERDRNMVFQCVYPTGEMSQTEIIIESPCGPSEWMCRDGTCLPQAYFCNGRPDCRDGSDEQPPHCAEVVRPTIRPERPIVRPYGSLEIECRSNQPHIRPDMRLSNGTSVELLPRFEVTRPRNDVIVARLRDITERDRYMVIQCVYPTGESSETEIVIDSPCGPADWMCRNGQCIPQSYFCNGRPDCSDGSDEQPPHCYDIPVDTRCGPHEFRCATGECIDIRLRCDRQRNCDDGSDEEGCETRCESYEFRCTSGECIDARQRCDRRRDCHDGSDEDGCETRCESHEFRCTSGECIDSRRRCDRQRDCYDGSDEEGCETRCEPHEFRCTSGECIDSRRRCDKQRDCYDGSDEEGCGESSQTIIIIDSPCGPHEVMCRDGSCVPVTAICDGRPDCPDGSDEQPPRCYVIASVEMRPTVIRTSPYEPFTLECISHNQAIRPYARFSDGRAVEDDNRFRLNYLTSNHLEIRALYGLTERDDLSIMYVQSCSVESFVGLAGWDYLIAFFSVDLRVATGDDVRHGLLHSEK